LFFFSINDNDYTIYRFLLFSKRNKRGIFNSILTALSIVFGFWILIIGKEPKDFLERSVYKIQMKFGIIPSFISLVISIILIYFSALKMIQPVWVLISVTIGFIFNVWLMGLYLYLKISD